MASHPLDNVIWQALGTRQAGFARQTGGAKKLVDDVGPLAAFEGPEEQGYKDLAALAANGRPVGLFIATPWQARQGWAFIAGAPLWQMVRESQELPAESPLPFTLEPLGAAQSAEMQELAGLVKPGPFGPRTHELGSFFGVRHKGKLVAMAGERLKVPGHTELSAVCTHPDHTGKGYAAALMNKVIAGIIARGETAFLHVRGDNDRAIALYERLGFRARWKGHFAAIAREE